MLLRSASPPVAPSGIGAWSRTLRRRRGPMPDDDGAADMFMLQFLPFGRCPVEIGAPAPARKAPSKLDPRFTAIDHHLPGGLLLAHAEFSSYGRESGGVPS